MAASSSVRPRLPRPNPAPRSPLPKPDSDLNCPRCHTLLTDPQGLGLCPRCSYCRSLQGNGAAVLAEVARVRRWQPILRGLEEALRVAPPTVIALCVAFVAVVPMAYLADQRFPLGSPARAVWSAGSLFCGVLLLLTGQTWAVPLLRDMKERVTWADMLSPLRVWAMTLRRLPDTAWPVGLGASGMLAILAAVVWVGGLSYWFRFYPTAEEASGAFVAARRSDAQGEQELDRVSRVLGFYKSQADAPAAWASDGSASTSAPRASGSATSRPAASAVLDSRPTERCVIVGIVPASGGQPPGLVLARLRDGQLAFAGVVRSGLNKMPGVLDRLSKLGRTRPLVEGLNLDAVWVRPEVFCEVHQSGSNSKGEFVDPTLKGLIED